MIGIEYILKIFDISNTELAEELGIKKQNITRWIKGERPIPKKYLPILSEKFKIPEEYYQKEINDTDRIEIQKLKLKIDEKMVIENLEDDEVQAELFGEDGTVSTFNFPETVLKLEGRNISIEQYGEVSQQIFFNNFYFDKIKTCYEFRDKSSEDNLISIKITNIKYIEGFIDNTDMDYVDIYFESGNKLRLEALNVLEEDE